MRPQYTRRQFLRMSAGSVGLLSCLVPVQAGLRAARRPNILFIMADDHTSQAWGCYGSRLAPYAPTRNIDRIRNEGALLSNCFCTNSICVPSRASILTGQYSHINGATTLAGRLAPETDNLAKRLKAAGYDTALVGKWHLKDQPAGFDYYNVLRGQGRYTNPILFESGKAWKGKGQVHQGHSTDVITDLALDWLNDRAAQADPFCLMVHFKAVHEPFYSHDRYRSLYADQDLPEPDDLLAPESPQGKCFAGWPLEKLTERFVKRPKNYAPPALKVGDQDPASLRRTTYQKFVKDFLRTVAGIDHNIGRLLRQLDQAGQSKDTVVIYTSDQGYFLGEHNLFDKRFMLEESLRMPFVVRYPREVKPKTMVDDIILNIDFAELLLDYAGANIPETMQGRSFRASLCGASPGDWRKAMYYRYWSHSQERPAHYGVRTQRFKLIFYYGLLASGRDPDTCWELYDLQADPYERVNVYDRTEHQARIVRLKQTLQALRVEFRDTADPF
jgi:arylsulfatase A-like enzyme